MSSLRIRVPFWSAAALAAGIMGIAVWHGPLFGAEAPVVIDPPSVDNPKAAGPPEIAVLAGGRPVSARNGVRP
jgi:hypothetical protein